MLIDLIAGTTERVAQEAGQGREREQGVGSRERLLRLVGNGKVQM